MAGLLTFLIFASAVYAIYLLVVDEEAAPVEVVQPDPAPVPVKKHRSK